METKGELALGRVPEIPPKPAADPVSLLHHLQGTADPLLRRESQRRPGGAGSSLPACWGRGLPELGEKARLFAGV